MSADHDTTPTLVDLLERAAANPDHGVRLLDRRENATFVPWPEIVERSRAACGALQRLGVEPGDRVALVFPTSFEFLESFFGTLLAGAVPVPVYPPVRLGRLDEYFHRTARMLELVGARVVLADRRVRRILGPAVEPASPPLGCRVPSDLPGGPAEPVRARPGDLALVQFSSGTTVDPKPVALSHRAVVAQTVTLNSFWPDTAERTHSGVSWLPLYHDMGLIGCIFPAVERPGTITLIPPEVFVAKPTVWLRTISRFRATLSPAPNFAYGLCVERAREDDLAGVDLSCWRIALNGAEPVVPRVLRTFRERFAPYGFRAEALTPVYGLSEAALAVTFSRLDEPFRTHRFDRHALSSRGHAIPADDGVELVSVGRPLPGFALRIVDGDGGDCADGTVGRLLVRGPSVMEGYLGQSDATARVLRDGWLDTGDLGFRFHGELYLTGREKDVLILRGRSHSPHEVEDAVHLVEGVRTGCVAAVSWLPEGADGEVLAIFVEARAGISPDRHDAIAEDAAAAVRSATGLSPDHVVVVRPGTLPRTSSGKLRRKEALRRYLDGTLHAPKKVTPARLAGALARSSAALARMRWKG